MRLESFCRVAGNRRKFFNSIGFIGRLPPVFVFIDHKNLID
jgi:hypothetical protein